MKLLKSNVHVKVAYGSTICNSQISKMTQPFVNMMEVEETAVNLHVGIVM